VAAAHLAALRELSVKRAEPETTKGDTPAHAVTPLADDGDKPFADRIN